MNKFTKLLAIVGLLAFAVPAFAGGEYIGSQYPGVPSIGDPCITFPHKTVSANISSATTTKLVGAVASANIYICGVHYFHPGGTGTLLLEAGTKVSTDCDTSATQLSPKWAGNTTAGTPFEVDEGDADNTVYTTSAVTSSELCAVSTGTIAQSIAVTYVQSVNTP